MKLIEMVRKCRDLGYRYVAVDRHGLACAYSGVPHATSRVWKSTRKYDFLGRFNLTCNWKDSLIDVTKVLVK